jgi:hypothetical protein
MSSRASNSAELGIVFLVGGIVLLSDPNCKCGCRTIAEHLLKAGFGLLSGRGT